MSTPAWSPVPDFRFTDIRYEQAEGIDKITIARPEVRNAFRPETVTELIRALAHAQSWAEVGVVILTGEGDKAFCSGGDQRVRGSHGGYAHRGGEESLNVLDLQMQIRPAAQAGGGHGGGIRHRRGQRAAARVRSHHRRQRPFRPERSAGGQLRCGAGSLAAGAHGGAQEGQGNLVPVPAYDAQEALAMGLVKAVVPLDRLEAETVAWCREMLRLSPTALRAIKAAFNADTDGLAGIQELAGVATGLFYKTDEGRDAFLEKRSPHFRRFERWR